LITGKLPKISERKLPAEKEKTKLQDTGRQVEARILEARHRRQQHLQTVMYLLSFHFIYWSSTNYRQIALHTRMAF
jgi:two-component sensor histidine kinase